MIKIYEILIIVFLLIASVFVVKLGWYKMGDCALEPDPRECINF